MRRLNVKLALWLVGITLISVVGVHLLHGYQLERNADFLRVQAEKAKADDKVEEAVKQYVQYLKYRDDPEGYESLAGLVVRVAGDADATNRQKWRAYSILEEAIRRHPDLDSVRRQLVDYTLSMGRFDLALDHIDYLIKHGASDTSLDLKANRCYVALGEEEKALRKPDPVPSTDGAQRAKSLCEMLGYDPDTQTFADQPPAGATEIDAFDLLARVLGRKPDGAVMADAVMSKLVEWNPDSARAHLLRANYLASLPTSDAAEKAKKFEEAEAELARAFELAPHDADVVLTAAGYAMTKRDFAKAQTLLDEALERFPDRQDVYVRLSMLATTQEKPDLAIEQLKLGLKKSTEVQAILERLIDLQFQRNELADVRETLKQMQDRPFMPEFLRFQEARLKYSEGNYLEASRELAAVRPAIARLRGNHVQQLDVMLGRCYEELGQPDSQLEVYRRLLQTSPDLLIARIGHAAALQSLGRIDEATKDIDILVANGHLIPMVQPFILQMLVAEQLAKPESARDWTNVEKLRGQIQASETRTAVDNAIMDAELQIARGQLDEAQKSLTGASKQDPKDLRVWLALAKLIVRQGKSNLMPQLIKRAEKEVGDVPFVRIERLRTILRNGGDNAGEELKKLEEGLDKYSKAEHETLMLQLGTAYLQLKDYSNAKRCWKYVIEQQPANASLRQLLFDMAIDHRDEPTMQEIQKEVHDSKYLGSQSPLYKYCAASLIVWPMRQKQAKLQPIDDSDRKLMAQARKLIDDGIAQRLEWSVLWRLRGEIYQIEGDTEGAITSYQRALEFNRSGQTAVGRRLVQLLYMNNRISEANDALKYVGSEAELPDVWKRTVEDIIMRLGAVDAAIDMAKREVDNTPDNVENQVWYGQLLTKAGRSEEAEAAFRQATKIAPTKPEVWNILIEHLLSTKKKAEAVEAARAAEQALPDNPLALAQFSERVGEMAQSESLFQQAMEKTPDDLGLLRRVAQHYFDYYFTTSGNSEKTAPLLDQIVKKTEKADDDTSRAALRWARRMQAQILAQPKDYAHIVEATKLIERNARDGELPDEDAMAIVSLLVNRPELASRQKAIALLEKIQKRRGELNASEQAALGQLYERAGKWTEARDLMLSSITQRPDDAATLAVFADMLIRHGEYDDASHWVDRLEEALAKSTSPLSPTVKQSTVELRARLLAKNGHADQAVPLLEALIVRPLAQRQLHRLEEVSRQLELIEQYDAAERLLNEYVSQEPRGTIAKAAFLGRRGELDKAFALLDESRKNQPIVEVMACAMEALRKHPEKFTAERYKTMEDWAKAALQTEADPLQIKLILAELYDFQGRYPEVIKLYREVLADEKATTFQKVVSRNNLAYVLAINKQDSAEALKLTEETIQMAGPTSDLLDTRALVYLALGNIKPAIADLQMALVDQPTPNKYFHLAEAERQANNLDAARQALAKAQELGVDASRLPTPERNSYNELVERLK